MPILLFRKSLAGFSCSRDCECNLFSFSAKYDRFVAVRNPDQYRYDLNNASSSTDCTGLIPTPPQSEAELESYDAVYHFALPQIDKNINRLHSIVFRLQTNTAFFPIKGFYGGFIANYSHDDISIVRHLLRCDNQQISIKNPYVK